MWPQYFALTLVLDMLARRPVWRTRRAYFNTNISTIEPFMESLAQLVIKIGIWTFFVQDHMESHQGAENPLFDKGWEANFFYFTTFVSALASVMGIVRFFKDGPVRFLPQAGPLGGLFTLKYFLTFLTVFLNVAAKILLLVLMLFYSLGIVGVVLPTSSGGDLVGTVDQPLCEHLSVVCTCSDASFQVRPLLQSPDLTVEWGEPSWRVFVMETGHGSIIFWDPEEATWREGNRGCLVDKLRDDCEYRLTNNCGGGGEGIRLYCSDDLNIISRSRLIAMVLWLLLNIFPQLLLSLHSCPTRDQRESRFPRETGREKVFFPNVLPGNG